MARLVGADRKAAACLSIDHAPPFMTTIYHPLMATSRMIMNHVTKQKLSQSGFMNMTVSAVTFSFLPRQPDLDTEQHLWDVAERQRKLHN